MKKSYYAEMVLISIFAILIGLLNVILTFIRKSFQIFTIVKDAATSNLDYGEVGTWASILVSVGNAFDIFTGAANIVTVLQIIGGVTAIVLIILLNNQKIKAKSEKFKFLPFAFGILCCFFGFVSYTFLFLSKRAFLLLKIIMFFTTIVLPILFTVTANKFRKGDTV